MAGSFQTISPVDGSVYVEREFASPADIEEALAKRLGDENAARLRQILEQDWGQPIIAQTRHER